ncbi:hypothetical protein O181_051683 [Austropuccinia psidii MF-1]|uniref:Uncharacterized protein n=1 Tax=Austropuccinia psidii MF-1 TaxID=1389203 RepID=A0A9Q3E1C1_9BASI|nr:hypothetical protein [Austropuccinia psidii MF-1]
MANNRLKLVFSFFADWFNPRGNMLSGKKESLGCLVLTCLNLPPFLYNKPAFNLLYVIIPGPNSPDIITISHVLKPLVDELLVLKDSVTVKTSQNPEGKQVYVHLLPLIGDLVAIHEAVGFGSHLANQFCSWCKCEANNLPLLKTGAHRIRMEVIEAEQAWKEAKSVSVQEQIRKKTGVWWSELNRIPYQIPNMHIALGVMHNWLEGVLSEHFLRQWVFREDAQEKKKRRLKARAHKGKRMCLENNRASDDGDLMAKSEGLSEMSSNDVQLGKGVGGGFMTKDQMDLV